jgi:hypothetical protein
MQTTAKEVYNQIIRDLSPIERLRLATLILNDLVGQHSSVIDQSDAWAEEDQVDVLNFSLQYASRSFFETEEM